MITMQLQLINVPLRGIRILKVGPAVIQTATLTGRGTRGGPVRLPKAFPYETKRLTWITGLFDSTIAKVCEENARIIAVDGPIGVGKSAFCKTLAEEFDMHYIPEPNMDPYYVLPSGYDLRQHDHQMPEKLKSYDHRNFCVDPKNVKAGIYQIRMLKLRFRQYVDALCHLLNTGQGVILERNYYSDYVFMKAMYANKYVSRAVHDAYFEIYRNTSITFPKPHLVIYLDIPVPVVQERIRTRNYSYEQNSPALTTEYLKSLEKFWKQDYIKNAEKSSEVLVYDWTDGGDIDVVVDDIEKLDLNVMRQDKRFIEWWIPRKFLLDMRRKLTNDPFTYDPLFYYPTYMVDELFVSEEDRLKWGDVLSTIPECKYDLGYNPHFGDSVFNVLFKINTEAPRQHKIQQSYEGNIQ